jgi:hypothetical protein
MNILYSTTHDDLLLLVFEYLPTVDLNNCSLANSQCEYIARCAFIQTRISKEFYKNPHCGGDALPNAQSYFSYFVRRVMVPIKQQIRTLLDNKQKHQNRVISHAIEAPLQLLIKMDLACEVLFDSLAGRKDINLREYWYNGVSPLHKLASYSEWSNARRAFFEILVNKYDTPVHQTEVATACISRNFEFLNYAMTIPNSRSLCTNTDSYIHGLCREPLTDDIDKREQIIDQMCSIVELLVENGYVLSNGGYGSAYDQIFQLKSARFVKKLVQLGLKVTRTIFKYCGRLGDIDLYETLANKSSGILNKNVLNEVLDEACMYAPLEFITFLIEREGAPLTERNVYRCLEKKRIDVARHLLDRSKLPLTASLMASVCGLRDIEAVKLLREYNVPFSGKVNNIEHHSILSACSSHNLELIKLIIADNPASLYVQLDSLSQVFSRVLMNRSIRARECLLYLLSCDAEFSISDIKVRYLGRSSSLPENIIALIQAFKSAYNAQVLDVFYGTANYSSWDRDEDAHFEACSAAIITGRVDMLEMLLKVYKNSRKVWSVDKAVQSESPAMLRYILSRYQPRLLPEHTIIRYYGENNPDLAILMLDVVMDLYPASIHDIPEVILNKADYSVIAYVRASLNFTTPLHRAIYRCDAERVKQLLQEATDQSRDAALRLPVHCAISTGNVQIAKLFGALIDEEQLGHYCIHFAAESGSLEMIQYVAENMDVSQSIFTKDNHQEGNNVLHKILTSSPSYEMAFTILKYFVSQCKAARLISMPNTKGNSPFSLACNLSMGEDIIDYMIVENQRLLHT